MATLVDCPSCSCKLKVPDDLLGARVRCPTCGGQFDAGASPSPPPIPSPPEPPQATTPSSLPPSPPPPAGEMTIKLSLDDDLVHRPPPDLSPPPPPSRPSEPGDELRPCPYCGERIGRRAVRCPYCEEELDAKGDDRPWEHQGRYGVRRDWEPHRGTLVLILGILSIVAGAMFFLYICWIPGLPLGIVAWIMGHRDLKKMKANVMDPEGQGMTQGGWICGIIGTVLNALMALVCIGLAGVIGFAAYQDKQAKPMPPPKVKPAPPPKFNGPAMPLRLQDYLPTRVV